MQTSLGLFHIIIYHLRLRLKDVYCGIDSKTIVHIGYSMMNRYTCTSSLLSGMIHDIIPPAEPLSRPRIMVYARMRGSGQ